MGGGGSGGFGGGSGMGGANDRAPGQGGIPDDLYNEMFPGTVPGTGGYSQPGLSDQEIIAQMPGGEPQTPAQELPQLGDTTQAQDAAAAKQRRARSRASTILTGANQAQGIGPGVGTISRRMLLGS